MTQVMNPLRTACLVALVWSWCWAVIAACVGLNALIKSNQDKTHIKSVVPSPGVATINTDDVLHSGIVLTAVNAFIGVLLFLFASLSLLPRTQSLINKTLHYQSYILFFCSAWVFATLIAFTHFFQTGSAQVRIFIGRTELSQEVIQGMAARLGITNVYRHIDYLRLVAVLPWLSLLFTVITAVILLTASKKVEYRASNTAPRDPKDDLRSETEKLEA